MFSIVIPLFNKAHTIERTLNTVFAQDFTEFELIIVNDGSTDDWLKVINKFRSDSRLKIFDQENKGVSAARNAGVYHSSHNYIAFLDGDDEWEPNYLSMMSEAIEKYPEAGMFCCAGRVRNADGSHVYRLAEKYNRKITTVDFFENPHVFLHTSAVVIKKSVFNEAGGFPLGMVRNEDYAFFFSAALLTPVVYCGFPLSTYVGGVAGQATSTPIHEVLDHVIARFNIVQSNFLKYKVENKTYHIFNKYEVRHNVIIALREGNYNYLNKFMRSLHPDIIKLFSTFELNLYKKEKLRKLAIYAILISKIRWRLRGYPRINYNQQ